MKTTLVLTDEERRVSGKFVELRKSVSLPSCLSAFLTVSLCLSFFLSPSEEMSQNLLSKLIKYRVIRCCDGTVLMSGISQLRAHKLKLQV